MSTFEVSEIRNRSGVTPRKDFSTLGCHLKNISVNSFDVSQLFNNRLSDSIVSAADSSACSIAPTCGLVLNNPEKNNQEEPKENQNKKLQNK